MSTPQKIGNAEVVKTAVVNLLSPKDKVGRIAFGLAICKCGQESGYYLFCCDDNWEEFSDTWHETIEDAEDQAEYQYPGINSYWV